MTLYEYFNTTNQTSPHFERHDNFVTTIQVPTCALVQTLPPLERCEYVTNTEHCRDNVFVFDYIDFLYCQFHATTTYSMAMGILILIMICAYLFLVLATTADGFFCPSLKVLSNLLGLSENVAGVTLLAFGNGAPDFFTSLTGLNGESRRLFSDIFGAAIFVVFVVGGLITAFTPFRLQPGIFMRDICFLLLDILYIDYAIKRDNIITMYEAISILALYVVYIIVVLTDQFLLIRETRRNRWKHGRRNTMNEAVIGLTRRVSIGSSASSYHSYAEDYKIRIEVEIENSKLFMQFRNTITPFTAEQWNSSNIYWRFVLVLQMPVQFILKVFIPIVDYDLPFNGWSKLLNCIQIVLLPTIFTYFVASDLTLLVAPISLPIAVMVFRSTDSAEVPFGHDYFSILGTLGSVTVVYSVAAELNSVLDVIGITTYRSNSYLGCTLLGWGNSIGDLTADIALALQGYQLMAFSACYGGPLFNSLTVIGVALIYKCSLREDWTIKIGEGTMGENSTIFMIIGLFCIMFGTSMTNFLMRRTLGMFMIIMYCLYITFCTFAEFGFIHPYGSDHRMDLIVEPKDE